MVQQVPRMFTIEDAKKWHSGTRFHTVYGECEFRVGARGGVYLKTSKVFRITGRVRTWKREPERFEIPVKHGIYGPSTVITEKSAWCHLEDECHAVVAYRAYIKNLREQVQDMLGLQDNG